MRIFFNPILYMLLLWFYNIYARDLQTVADEKDYAEFFGYYDTIFSYPEENDIENGIENYIYNLKYII